MVLPWCQPLLEHHAKVILSTQSVLPRSTYAHQHWWQVSGYADGDGMMMMIVHTYCIGAVMIKAPWLGAFISFLDS